MDKLLLTPTEAAHVLGIGRSKVYELDADRSAHVRPHRGLSARPRRRAQALPRAAAHSRLRFSTDATREGAGAGRTG